ncbi:hypothetical protein Hanom_Chr05g00457011 [Helianthus anomalus]
MEVPSSLPLSHLFDLTPSPTSKPTTLIRCCSSSATAPKHGGQSTPPSTPVLPSNRATVAPILLKKVCP